MTAPRPFQGRTKGLGLRFQWGDQCLGDFFIPSGQKRVFRVGRARGVDFVMDDAPLGARRFEVMRSDGRSYTLRFTGTMHGELLRAGETRDLQAIIASGEASHEGGAYALTLQDGDVLAVELGGVTLRARHESVPQRVRVPLGESLDFPALTLFLGVFLLASMFVLSAPRLAEAGDGHATASVSNDSRIVRLLVRPPGTRENRFLEKLHARKTARGPPSQGVKETPKAASTRTRYSRSIPVHQGIRDRYRLSLGGLTYQYVPVHEPRPVHIFKEFVVRRSMPRPQDVVGLLPKQTRCIDTGVGSSADDSRSCVDISADDVTVHGALEKWLVRQVIHRNRGQIRFCYERLLPHFPKLGGTLVIRFTIAADGSVSAASVARSTTGSSQLEQCVVGRFRTWTFPAAKDGGRAVVTYPLAFQAHEG